MTATHDCNNCKWAYKAREGVRCARTTEPEVKQWCGKWEHEEDARKESA